MEVILLKNVGALGMLGEKVTVRGGYGRNYLVPYGFALPATADNLAAFEARRAELERIAASQLAEAQARRNQLEGLTITIARKAGDEGRLFGSVGSTDIAAALKAAGVEIGKQTIRLAAGPLRVVGEYEVAVRLHPEVDATIKVTVVPQV